MSVSVVVFSIVTNIKIVIKSVKDKVNLSSLQFADDTLLFCKYDEAMLDTLIQTIEFFEWCTGQKVNWKSALCGVKIDENTLISISNRLNYKAGTLPFIYLGLPLGGYPK